MARFAAGVCGFCFQEAPSASDSVVLMTRVYREDGIYPRSMAEEGHGTDVSVHGHSAQLISLFEKQDV